MKTVNGVFWITTSLISAMMLFSAYNYLANAAMKEAFIHLGFPNYFRLELAVAKILGAIVLLIPMVSSKVKEFAYAGFFITFVSAFIAHTASGDPVSIAIFPLLALALLVVSYIYFSKIEKDKVS